MSGFHNIASVATKPTAGSKDQKAAYLRYTTVDKAYACMPFMSYDTGSVKGDLNFPISGMGTSGNANVQKSFSLSDGSGIILTVAKVKPYITETFDGVGLEPDIEIAAEPGSESDTQRQKAINYLSSDS